jgi:CxxC motif-containing protein (DUF1111 family)
MRFSKCAIGRSLSILVALMTVNAFLVPPVAGEERPGLGQKLFEREWRFDDPISPTGGDGLGPMFNDRSCVACHDQGGPGGGGDNDHNVQLLTLLSKALVDKGSLSILGINQADETWARKILPKIHSGFSSGGSSVILHKFSIAPSYAALRMNLSGRTAFPYVLLLDDKLSVQRIPLKHGDLIRIGRALLQTSARNTPPLFGLGLVDKMPPSTLNRVMSGQRKRSPGVAGQVAGKFGWRGQTASLREFVLGACANELGLTTPGNEAARIPNHDYDVSKPDMSSEQMTALINYVSELPPPKRLKVSGVRDARVMIRGARVFDGIQCNACHIKNVGGVAGIYSDLLLHDMGDNLYDPAIQLVYYGSGSLEQARQWKTPPLWGVRNSAPYMHDGRAATLDEAIRMHGGQAATSRDAYVELDDAARANLLVFVNSLGAP